MPDSRDAATPVNGATETVVVDRAMETIARTRSQGMHLLGHFVGISGQREPGGAVRLTLAPQPPEPSGRTTPVSMLAFCVFADLVVSSAIRAHLQPGQRLGTVTLSIQHVRMPAAGPVLGAARGPAPDDGYGTAQATYSVDGEVIGHAQASAMALAPPSGRVPRLLPWERDDLADPPRLTPEDLDATEALFLTNARAAHGRSQVAGTSVEDELLHFTWDDTPSDRARGELATGPELTNRVGHLQGGALYAAAVRAAGRALGGDGWEPVEGTYQFLRPGDGAVLRADAVVMRRGRNLAYVRVDLGVDGREVGTGLFTFRARPTPAGSA